jgi:hypothetical protein
LNAVRRADYAGLRGISSSDTCAPDPDGKADDEKHRQIWILLKETLEQYIDE